jgi:hypothetical protein
LLLLLELLHNFLVKGRFLFLLNLSRLRLLGRSSALISFVDHREDNASHLAALVGSDHIQVGKRLLMEKRLVELDSVSCLTSQSLLLLDFMQGAQENYSDIY